MSKVIQWQDVSLGFNIHMARDESQLLNVMG